LADTAFGLVGAETMFQDAPLASCTALPASVATSPDETAPSTQTPAPEPTQQATTTTTKPKKQAKKRQQSTTDQILNQAGDVANSISSSIRSGVDSVIGSSSSGGSHKTKKSKPDK
jgi:hypothetical protein